MKRKHIIISGTGRAGTTFLVQLFTALGFDTKVDINTDVLKNCNAGLSWDIRQDNAPYIVKSPLMCDYLDDTLTNNTNIEIEYAIIPIRDLFSAAESRRDVSKRTDPSGELVNIPGGLWCTIDPNQQEQILTEKFYNLIYALVKHNIPIIFMFFPRIVNDPEYLYKKLFILLGNVSFSEFKLAFDGVVKPQLVHNFSRIENDTK